MNTDIEIKVKIEEMKRRLSEDERIQFEFEMRSLKKTQSVIAGLAAVGFVGAAGIHRFFLGQVGLGILMLLTGGACGVWTIIDIVNAGKLAEEYNLQLEYDKLEEKLLIKERLERSQG